MANNEFSKFGFYSYSTHNTNSRNTGYKNTLNVDSNFSTTLGVNFTTVVGANFATTGGFNIPVTIGGKIELICPWSIKWTKGGFSEFGKIETFNFGGVPDYDYDFKDCQTQVKVNNGKSIYTRNSKDIKNFNYSPKTTDVTEDTEQHSNKASEWYKEKLICAEHEVKEIKKGEEKFGTLKTTVDESYVLSVAKGESQIFIDATLLAIGSSSTVKMFAKDTEVVCEAGKMTINSAIVNVG